MLETYTIEQQDNQHDGQFLKGGNRVLAHGRDYHDTPLECDEPRSANEMHEMHASLCLSSCIQAHGASHHPSLAKQAGVPSFAPTSLSSSKFHLEHVQLQQFK